jgi:hypothetical protein
MKNFYAYIVRNKEGKILDPSFIIGQLETIHLLEKDEAFSMPIHRFMELVHNTEEEAQETITWYGLACEKTEQKPEKLHVEKVQLTLIFREV